MDDDQEMIMVSANVQGELNCEGKPFPTCICGFLIAHHDWIMWGGETG